MMKAIVLGVLLVASLCWSAEKPEGMAWLSLDTTGVPVLTELDATPGEDLTVYFFLQPEFDSMHAFMMPVQYDPNLEVVKMEFYGPTFSTESWCQPLWNYFPNNDPESHRLMFYAWTATYACGFAPGDAYLIGSAVFKVLDKLQSEVVFDTCAFPPRCHLSVTNGPQAMDHWPNWQPVKGMKPVEK